MRFLPHSLALSIVAMAALGGPVVAMADDTDSKAMTVTAAIGSRTSLKVSSQLLQFDVRDPGDEAVAVVDFSAGARTRQGGEVVLTVEPQRAAAGPGGAADVETALTFAGEGDATLSGTLLPMSPSVAGRWSGSGLRTGRVMFALRASASGNYRVPVRFVLSTP
jgi:hypothetical protein